MLSLQLIGGEYAESLGITGPETFTVEGIDDAITAKRTLKVAMTKADGAVAKFDVLVRLDRPVDVLYYKNGGILQTVLRNVMKA